MKLTTTMAIAMTSIALVGSAFAGAPAAPANPSNTDKEMADAAKKIAEAMKQDAHQDADGQKHLDQKWNELLKGFGLAPGSIPDPFTYEGGPKDAAQDAHILADLNKWLVQHHQPTVFLPRITEEANGSVWPNVNDQVKGRAKVTLRGPISFLQAHQCSRTRRLWNQSPAANAPRSSRPDLILIALLGGGDRES